MRGSQSNEHCDLNANGSKIKCQVNSVSLQRSQLACSYPHRRSRVAVAMGAVTVVTAAAIMGVTVEVTTEVTPTMLGGRRCRGFDFKSNPRAMGFEPGIGAAEDEGSLPSPRSSPTRDPAPSALEHWRPAPAPTRRAQTLASFRPGIGPRSLSRSRLLVSGPGMNGAKPNHPLESRVAWLSPKNRAQPAPWSLRLAARALVQTPPSTTRARWLSRILARWLSARLFRVLSQTLRT